MILEIKDGRSPSLFGVLGGIVILEERTGLLSEGDAAPDFEARLSTGEIVRLSDFRQKKNVVLYFYPKDFTSGCSQQACSFRDNYAELLELDAVIFGVSSDNSASHRDFIDAYKLPFPLIADMDKSISRAYGVTRPQWISSIAGLKRVTYVIDKHGITRRVIHRELRIDRHIAEALDALRCLEGAGGTQYERVRT